VNWHITDSGQGAQSHCQPVVTGSHYLALVNCDKCAKVGLQQAGEQPQECLVLAFPFASGHGVELHDRSGNRGAWHGLSSPVSLYWAIGHRSFDVFPKPAQRIGSVMGFGRVVKLERQANAPPTISVWLFSIIEPAAESRNALAKRFLPFGICWSLVVDLEHE
jgi:hypothetical protein